MNKSKCISFDDRYFFLKAESQGILNAKNKIKAISFQIEYSFLFSISPNENDSQKLPPILDKVILWRFCFFLFIL